MPNAMRDEQIVRLVAGRGHAILMVAGNQRIHGECRDNQQAMQAFQALARRRLRRDDADIIMQAGKPQGRFEDDDRKIRGGQPERDVFHDRRGEFQAQKAQQHEVGMIVVSEKTRENGLNLGVGDLLVFGAREQQIARAEHHVAEGEGDGVKSAPCRGVFQPGEPPEKHDSIACATSHAAAKKQRKNQISHIFP